MRSIDKVLLSEEKIEKEISSEEKKLQKAYDKRKTQLNQEFESFTQEIEIKAKDELENYRNEVDTKSQNIISLAQQQANTLSYTQLQESITSKIKEELEK